MKKLKAKFIKLDSSKRLYHIQVPIIGLTGGVGTGKSTVAEFFRNNEIPVIDADKLVKNIYSQSETLAFIKSHFPETIFHNEINFKNLREIVFKNPTSKKLIEEFIYERLPAEFKRTYSLLKSPSFIVYDVPLLFEKKLDSLVDLSICVYAPKEVQIERITKRDKCTIETAENILNQQIDIEEKKKLADFVILNIGNLKDLNNQLEKLLTELSTTQDS